jgi:D-tyrosyl-tRNA(Tyr) deacylase
VIAVVQRVAEARVLVAGECVGAIARGLLVLLGVEHGDTAADADATAKKVAALRVFPGHTPTDLAVGDVGGGCLVVSQFTLAAELASGNRPDFTGAAPPEAASGLCARVVERLAAAGVPVATGRFGASMRVELVNDGPFTLVLTVRGGRVVARPPAV